MCKMLSNLSKVYVKWPSIGDHKTIIQNFNDKNKLPNVAGAVDGTHIAISPPKTDTKSYYNRKGFYSILMQAICDSQYRFIDVFIGWPGRAHDAAVWSNSPIGKALQHKEIILPDNTHLVGDSAYPLSGYLLTPFKDYGNVIRRRTRAATSVVTTIPNPHTSTLLQESNSTILAKSAINEAAQNNIMNDDQQCYASPKRKESKIDNTVNVHAKTRSTTRCNGISNHSTKSSALNGGASNSYINMAKIKGSHNHHHHHHHHHHHSHPHYQQEQQHQKTITKYFTSVDTKPTYKLIDLQNKTHSYNGDIYNTDDFLIDQNNIENNLIENDIGIDLNKNIEGDNEEEDEEEEEEEENFSDESNKNDILNGSMNCSGINIALKINKEDDTNIDIPNENLLIQNERNNTLNQVNDKNNDDNGYFTNSSTSSTSSSTSLSMPLSNVGKIGDITDKMTRNVTAIALPVPSLIQNTMVASKNNLFLQEPVLSLNIDKSPNQPSSIKINKTFEVESVFSTVNLNSNSNSICLNGFNKIVTLKSSPKRSVSSDAETIILNNCNFDSLCSNYNNNNNNNYNNNNSIGILLSIDNNSNDSGVIIDQNSGIMSNIQPEHINNNQQYQNNTDYISKNINQRDELSPNKRRKPTTPHRILCPSPIKLPLVEKCLTSSRSSSMERTPIINKINTATHGVANGAQKRYPKSRRRLNTPQSENSSIALPQLGGVNLTDETLKRINKQQQKLIFNSIKNSTTQHNLNNNNIITNNQSKLLSSHNISPSRQNAQVLYDTNSIQNQAIVTTVGDISKGRIIHQMKPPPGKPIIQTQQKPPKTQHTQQTLKDNYPVRRSFRKTKTAVKEEMMRTLEEAILENREEGLKVKEFEGKGRGIVTTRKFLRGEFVVEYIGDLIDMNEANNREYKYSLDENAGCYMYYFKHKNQQYCIDATAESGKLGRLVNHSRNGNLMTKVVVVKSKPHLVLITRDDIEEGVELTYDYGDRSKEALQHHPWLAQ